MKLFFNLVIILVLFFSCSDDGNSGDPNILEINITAGVSTYYDIINELGQPERYYDFNLVTDFTPIVIPDDLPLSYFMYYDDEKYHFVMTNQTEIDELRIKNSDYFFINGLTTGLTLDEVISYLGEPATTLDGEPLNYVVDTLYLNIDGESGRHYYDSSAFGIRLFIFNHLTTAVYSYGQNKIQYYEE